MALILSLETSTKVCSVCLSNNDEIIAKRELFEANSHATHLTVFIQDIFSELSDYTLKDIDAVAVSSGPGSYTGLRIGVSVAKGLCYALKKPLIAITSLEALAHAAFNNAELMKTTNSNTLFCPMIDARRMEVYTALFDADMKIQKNISAEIIDENSFQDVLSNHQIVFLGDGSEKCKETISHENAIFLEKTVPLASNMVKLASKKYANNQFEDIAYFEPFYLKDFVATTPKKKVL
jgi:tRNA threonylcarbamoyladenosine biosynthesis protein TsaB